MGLTIIMCSALIISEHLKHSWRRKKALTRSEHHLCPIQAFFLAYAHFLRAPLLISPSITHFSTMHCGKTIRNLSTILQTDRDRKKKKTTKAKVLKV